MDATSASSSPIEENYSLMSTGKKTPLKMILIFRNFCPIRVEPPPSFFSISEITRAATIEGSDASQEDLLWAVRVVVINLAVTYEAMIRN